MFIDIALEFMFHIKLVLQRVLGIQSLDVVNIMERNDKKHVAIKNKMFMGKSGNWLNCLCVVLCDYKKRLYIIYRHQVVCNNGQLSVWAHVWLQAPVVLML